MSRRVPRRFVLAASIQLVSGLVNFAVLPLILFVIGQTLAPFTHEAVALCGLGGCLLAPVGLAEIGVALLGFASPYHFAPAMRRVTWAEGAALLAGALHAAVVAVVVRRLLADPDVAAFLRVPPEPSQPASGR